jgi:hypothetical protein
MIVRDANVWTNELRREFAAMIDHYATARDRLLKCETVLDVVKVEQDFIAARSKAYFDAGLRVAQLFSATAGDLAQGTVNSIAPLTGSLTGPFAALDHGARARSAH